MTRRGNTRNPVTVNRDMGVLSEIFTLAVKRKYCRFNPCKSVDRLPVTNGQRTAVLTAEDEIRLLEALNGEREIPASRHSRISNGDASLRNPESEMGLYRFGQR
jgi:hypothetical protein